MVASGSVYSDVGSGRLILAFVLHWPVTSRRTPISRLRAVVCSFLDIHGVDYRRRASSAALSPKAIAARAQRFTAAVLCWN